MKIRSVIMSVIMLTAMVSCQKSPDIESDSPGLGSKEHATVKLSIKTSTNTGVRAVTDATPVEGENEIKDITLIAFDAEGLSEVIIAQSTTEPGMVDDVKVFSFNLGKGEKTLVAIVNTGDVTMPDASEAGTYTKAELELLTQSITLMATEISEKSNFKMIGSTNINVVEDLEGNLVNMPNVTIGVSRLAAKVSLSVGPVELNIILNESKNDLSSAKVVISDYNEASAANKINPGYLLTQTHNLAQVFEPKDDYTTVSATVLVPTNYYSEPVIFNSDLGTSYEESFYCAKNNLALASQTTMNVTKVKLALQLIPKSFITGVTAAQRVAGAATYTLTYSPLSEVNATVAAFDGDETYYGFMHEGKIIAPFYSKYTALYVYNFMNDTEYASIPESAAITYPNCLNYYDIRVGDPDASAPTQEGYYSVKSNNYYKINVQSVVNFGYADKGPITPSGTGAIKVSIEILDWTVTGLNQDL